MFNLFNPDEEPEDFLDESTPETYKDSLVLMVYSQITHELVVKADIQPVLDWLLSLDEEALLHFLPQNNPVFKGTRPALNWFGSVEYTLLGDLADTIGLN